jgi:serine/threonine protein phosphatase PrpC
MGSGSRIGLAHAGYSAVGRRANNEDSHAYLEIDDPEGGVLVLVADGMGGHAGGEVASRLAVDVVAETYAAQPGSDTPRRLAAAVEAANAAVHLRSREDTDLAGMGTTLTALAVRGKQAVVAHVGDSRAYLFRSGLTTRLTRDHSVAAELGIREEDDAPRPPHAHMLTRALGAAPVVLVDVTDPALDVLPGDVFLLCSDGLSGTVSEEDMALEITRNDPETATRRLAGLALERGGTDNVTVEIVKVVGVGGTERRGVLARLRRTLGRRSARAAARADSEASERGGG